MTPTSETYKLSNIGVVPYVARMIRPSLLCHHESCLFERKIQLDGWFSILQYPLDGRTGLTYLGINMATIEAASNRSQQALRPGERTPPLSTRVLKAAEKNMAAMPTVGRGLALMTPYGRSRANAGRKASTVVTRNKRCSFLF